MKPINFFLYDSLTQKKKMINLNNNQIINIYCCGPTVYDYIHLGNARPAMIMDFLIRFLRSENYKVNYIQNITDIDDKIINKAIQENKTEKEITNFFSDNYLKDLKNMNILVADKIVFVCDIINPIQNFIQQLINNKSAYEIDGNVYFDIAKFDKEYGKLSNKVIDNLSPGLRVDIDLKKRNYLDFVLWKKTNIGQKWKSSWSLGRPGWHTECVTIIDHLLNNDKLTIHAGGIDLKFPHHENERIQYYGLKKQELASVWMHNGHLNFKNEKMSKSLGNVILVKDFIKQHSSDVLRWLFMSTNYKQPLSLSDDLIEQANKFIKKLINVRKKLIKSWVLNFDKLQETNFDKTLTKKYVDYLYEFKKRMMDDLNTPEVLSLIDDIVKNLNLHLDQNLNFFNLKHLYFDLVKIMKTLGFIVNLDITISKENVSLYQEWQAALIAKNFELADQLRKKLKEKELV